MPAALASVLRYVDLRRQLLVPYSQNLVADTGRSEGARVQGHLLGEMHLEVPL